MEENDENDSIIKTEEDIPVLSLEEPVSKKPAKEKKVIKKKVKDQKIEEKPIEEKSDEQRRNDVFMEVTTLEERNSMTPEEQEALKKKFKVPPNLPKTERKYKRTKEDILQDYIKLKSKYIDAMAQRQELREEVNELDSENTRLLLQIKEYRNEEINRELSPIPKRTQRNEPKRETRYSEPVQSQLVYEFW